MMSNDVQWRPMMSNDVQWCPMMSTDVYWCLMTCVQVFWFVWFYYLFFECAVEVMLQYLYFIRSPQTQHHNQHITTNTSQPTHHNQHITINTSQPTHHNQHTSQANHIHASNCCMQLYFHQQRDPKMYTPCIPCAPFPCPFFCEIGRKIIIVNIIWK